MRKCSHAVVDLLPHAPPMVLLDEVIGWDQGLVAAAVTIQKESPFFDEGQGVPAYVGLEYMAQTCGIYAGLEALHHSQPIRLGFLLGTRNFHTTRDWFKTGERLVIEASEVLRDEGMAVFSCRIQCDEQEIASAQLNLYQPQEGDLKHG